MCANSVLYWRTIGAIRAKKVCANNKNPYSNFLLAHSTNSATNIGALLAQSAGKIKQLRPYRD